MILAADTAINFLGLVLVAAIAGATPVFVARATGRENRENLRADWKRQDEVAARQEAAALAAQHAAESAAEQVATTTTTVNGKLDVIHTLVDGAMTAALRAEVDARASELAMMREVVDLKRHAGAEPNAETLALIDAADSTLASLRAALADRTNAVDRAAAMGATPAAPSDDDGAVASQVADELAARLTTPPA